MSINKFIGIGNLTRDPDVRYLPNGDAVANCSIACNETWKNKDGQKQEKVEFINLVLFKRLAEIAGEYLKKGSQIYVEGKVTTEKYTDKAGVEKYATKIRVDNLQMLGSKVDSADRPQPANAEAKPAPKVSGAFDNFDSEQIPF